MTALAATFDPTLCRQSVALSGLNALTDSVTLERAVDPYVQWTQVRGWAVQNIAGAAVTYFDYEFPEGVAYKYRVREFNAGGVELASTDFAVVAVTFTEVWLKVPAAPFLNRPVVVADRGDITNRSRSALMDVVGRTDPVQIGDLRASLGYPLLLLTETAAEERDMEYTLSTGDVIFVHLPAAEQTINGGYFSVGDVSRQSTLRRSPRRVWTLPVQTVAAPGPDVVGSAYTWGSVLAEYATWTEVMADNATWAALLARTGTPSEVIVP